MSRDPLRDGAAALTQQVAGLQLQARRLAAGVLSGLHRSLHRGGSAEFAEYAEYAPGDDPRTIDWKSVARTDRWFVKRYEETTNRRTFLVLDSSASMGFARGGRPEKIELARVVLASLAVLLIRQGDAVGVAVAAAGEDPQAVPPKARGSHVDALMTRLAAARPAGRTNLAATLDALAMGAPRRSLVVLASDLVDDVAAVGRALRRLSARGHELVVLQVLDQDEIEFSFQRTLRFRDPETKEEVLSDPAVVAEGYQAELRAFLEECERECTAARADRVLLVNSDEPARTLLTFLARRQALARRLVGRAA